MLSYLHTYRQFLAKTALAKSGLVEVEFQEKRRGLKPHVFSQLLTGLNTGPLV